MGFIPKHSSARIRIERFSTRGAESSGRGDLGPALRAEHSRREFYHWSFARRERMRKRLGNALNLDGRAIGQHFGDALHHFGGVIAHADDRVGPVLAGVLQQ